MAYTGRVKSFNLQKGWGFIECQETFHIANKDIFVLKTSLPRNLAVQPGDTVRFDVAEGQKGLEAQNVTMLMPAALAALNAATASDWSPRGPQQMMAPSAYQGLHVPPAGRQFEGVVKSFNEQKGWGFITCEALQLGKDIFFMKSSILGGAMVGQGMPVTFTMSQGNKGPEARDVQPVGLGGYGGYSGGCGGGYGGGCGGGYGGGPASPVAGLQANLSAILAANPALQALIPQLVAPGAGVAGGGKNLVGQTLVGTIKGWNEEKGWGHIACDAAREAYGKDVFFMKSVWNEQHAEIGALVSVKLTMGNKGPQAESLRLLPPNALSGQVFSGEVKSFNVEKGWGFVSGSEVLEVFGKDIFLHNRELGGAPPSVGDFLQFTVEVSNKGQLQAKNINTSGGAGVRVPGGGAPRGGVMQPPPTMKGPGYSPY